VIAMIEAARADGVRVSVDQYPYLAFGWNPSIFVPKEHRADGRDVLLRSYLPDPARRAVIAHGLADRISRYHDGDAGRALSSTGPAPTAPAGPARHCGRSCPAAARSPR
jgi:hypothetical protein